MEMKFARRSTPGGQNRFHEISGKSLTRANIGMWFTNTRYRMLNRETDAIGILTRYINFPPSAKAQRKNKSQLRYR